MAEFEKIASYQMGDTWYSYIAKCFDDLRVVSYQAKRDPRLMDEYIDRVLWISSMVVPKFKSNDQEEFWEKLDGLYKDTRLEKMFDLNDMDLLTDKRNRFKTMMSIYRFIFWLVGKCYENKLLIPTYASHGDRPRSTMPDGR